MLANAAVMVTLSGLDQHYQVTEAQLEEKRIHALARANAALAAAELVSVLLCLPACLPVYLPVSLCLCHLLCVSFLRRTRKHTRKGSSRPCQSLAASRSVTG